MKKQSKLRAYMLALLTSLFLLPSVLKAEGTTPSPLSTTVYWDVIDNILYISTQQDSNLLDNGETKTLEQSWTLSSSASEVPWEAQKSTLQGIHVLKSGTSGYVTPSNIKGWFSGTNTNKLGVCAYVNLEGLDTSNVTDMSKAFTYIYKQGSILTFGDRFDTSHVTDMSSMFEYNKCIDIDVSCFDTSNVTTMHRMFYQASSNLDLSGFDTRNVTVFDYMFNNYLGTSLTLGKNFVATAPGSLSVMFACPNISELDLSYFDTTGVKNMASMFAGASSLEKVTFGEKFDTSSTTNMARMFDGCASLKTINTSVLSGSAATTVASMFKNCTSLTSLDLSNLKTTSSLKNISEMFSGCTVLTSVDISGLNTTNVLVDDNKKEAFLGTPVLESITIGDTWTIGSFPDSGKPVWRHDGTGVEYGRDEIPALAGTYIAPKVKPILWKVYGTTLYLTTDAEGLSLVTNGGTPDGQFMPDEEFKSETDVPWYDQREDITAVTVGNLGDDDTVSPIYMTNWFRECKSLVQVSFTGLDSSDTLGMEWLFYNCTSLPENVDNDGADLQHLDLSSVRSMQYIFYNCASFVHLDFSDDGLLSNCRLDALLLSSKSGGRGLFSGCSSLEYLDISSWNFQDTANYREMFNGCTHLGTLVLPENFGSDCENLSHMFKNCASLTELDLSSVRQGSTSTVPVTSTELFNGCTSLQKVDLSNFITKNDTTTDVNMKDAFNNCYSLTEIKLGDQWNYPCFKEIPTQYFMVDNNPAQLVKSRNLTTVGTAHTYTRPTGSLIYWSLDQDGVLTIGSDSSLEGRGEHSGSFVDNVKLTPGWYNYRNDVRSVVTLDDGAAPQYTAGWFMGMSKCTSIDLSGLDLTKCCDMSTMFYRSGKLQAVVWPDADAMPEPQSLITTKQMFEKCESLISLDLHNLDTASVIDFTSMFQDCSALKELDISDKFVYNAAEHDNMLAGCTGLMCLNTSASISGYISNFGLPMPSDAILPGIVNGTFADQHGNRKTSTTTMQNDGDEAMTWGIILTVEFDTNGGTPAAIDAREVAYGQTLGAVPEVTRTGYTLDPWTFGEETYTSAELPDAIVKQPGTVVADWMKDIYTIAYELNGGTNDESNPDSYTVTSEDITFKPATRTGYAFGGWFEEEDFSGTAVTGIPQGSTGDVTLHAKFTPITYIIRYNGNGSTGGSMTDQTITYGISTALTANGFTRSGYNYGGWALAADSKEIAFADEALVFNLSDEQGTVINLYAIWLEGQTTYTVYHTRQSLDGTYPVDDPALTEKVTVYATTDSQVTPAVRSYPNFTSPESQTVTVNGNGSTTVYYQYARNAFLFTLGSCIGVDSTGSTANGTLFFETPIALTAQVVAGYDWQGWFNGTVLLSSQTTHNMTMPAADLTVTPKATAIEYTIAYNLDGGTVDGTNPTAYTVESADITLLNPVKTGYEFLGWTGTGIEGDPQTTVTIQTGSTGNRTYTANWKETNYPITYHLNDGIDGGENPHSYRITDTPVVLNAITRNGATFKGWYDNADFNGDAVTEIAEGSTGDKEFWAKWELITYTIAYELNDTTAYPATNSTSNPTSYTVGSDTITFAEPSRAACYTFGGWFTSSALGESTRITGIETNTRWENLTLYAKWIPVPYVITYNLDGGTNHPNNPSSYTVDSQTFIIHAPTKEGYVFAGWTYECQTTPTPDVIVSAGTTDDLEFTANWAEDKITIHHCPTDGTETTETVVWSALKAAVGTGAFDVTQALTDIYGGITAGYLYGGMWTDDTKDELVSTACGKELPLPEVGSHLYVREIPNAYGVPFVLSTRLGGVYHSMLMAPVDYSGTGEVLYKEAGFVFDKGSGTETAFKLDTLYHGVNVKNTDGTSKTTYGAKNCGCSSNDLVACQTLDDDKVKEWVDAGDPAHGLVAYYVTLDDVRVYSAVRKTVTFTISEKPGKPVADDDFQGFPTEKCEDETLSYGAVRLPMLGMNSFSLGDASEEDIILTLHVDGLVSQAYGKAGDDFRALAGAPVLAGSLFAGWHLDPDFTEPADFGGIDADTDLFASFVPAEGLLGLEARPAMAGSRLVRLRLLSACDDTAAFSCGFLVECGGSVSTVSAARFHAVDGTTAAAAFGASEDASLFYCDLPASAVKGAATLAVTPFWTTHDGTRVYGKTVSVSLEK